MSELSDILVDKLVQTLSMRALDVLTNHHMDLDQSMLSKPGSLAVPGGTSSSMRLAGFHPQIPSVRRGYTNAFGPASAESHGNVEEPQASSHRDMLLHSMGMVGAASAFQAGPAQAGLKKDFDARRAAANRK